MKKCSSASIAKPPNIINYKRDDLGLGSWSSLPTFPGSDQLVDSLQDEITTPPNVESYSILFLKLLIECPIDFLIPTFTDQKTKMCDSTSLTLVLVTGGLMDSNMVLMSW